MVKEKNFVQMLDLWNTAKRRKLSPEELRVFLSQVETEFHRKDFLPTDPVEFLHRYQSPRDQELVGLLAALLAYGNVKIIRRSVETALEKLALLGSTPSEAILTLGSKAGVSRAEAVFSDFRHRFNSGRDLVVLFRIVHSSWQRFGSLGDDFVSRLDEKTATVEDALSGFVRENEARAKKMGADPSFFFLLNDPKQGSACKRWCMYLRWMGRKDDVDLGLWNRLPSGRGLKPHQLVIPLDTHLAKIVRRLKLTKRNVVGWKMALEVTERLKGIDERDPIRYDFALCRLGILKKI